MEIKKIFTSSLSKKNTILVYFTFFIFLNIFDFLNLLSNDLDFFKKILSWTIIIYFFYKISFTKILIGKKEKIYDILYLIFFSLIAIPKSLLLHLFNLGSYNDIINSNEIFFFLLGPLKNYLNDFILLILFITGIIGIIITSISLISNKEIKKPSLISSLNIKENYFKIHRIILITISISLFFGIIIFNLFMEWFALAVDSLILVLGLIYYIFKYIKEHTNSQISSTLNNISNSGNSFFQKLIENLSDKKTFSITLGLFMTLHLLVDAGVYLVPYSIGTENQLYLQQLNTLGTEHTPIFNFFNFENSQLNNDFQIIKIFEENNNINLWYLKLQALILHLGYIIFFLILLISPFYLYYKAVNNEKINIPRIFNIFFLTFIFLSLTIITINLSSIEYNVINTPISFKQINSFAITGVDIHTNSIFKDNKTLNGEKIILLPIIVLIILIFIIFKYEKYEFFWKKLTLILILIFSLYYLFLFGNSIISKEINSISNEINNQNFQINKNYSKIYLSLEEPNSIKTRFETQTNNFKIISQILNFENKLYLHTQLISTNQKNRIQIETENKIFQYNNAKNYINKFNTINYFEELKHTGIRFTLDQNGDYYFSNFNQDTKQQIIQLHYMNDIGIKKSENARKLLEKTAEYLRLILTLIYFIFGSIAFTNIYIKRVILQKE